MGGLLNAGGAAETPSESPCLSKGAGMNFSVVSSCGCAFALVLLDRFKLQFGVLW